MNIDIDTLLMCEGISAGIIENYNIIGLYMCLNCGEEIKNNTNTPTTYTDVLVHVISHNIDMIYTYNCHICNQEFKTYIERQTHLNTHYTENKVEYKYQCPICNAGYNTQISLGEHFMTEHNDYEELGSLDDSKAESESYPTFEVLHKIGMMKFITLYDDDNFNINNNECLICCSRYTGLKKSNTDDDINTVNRYDKYFYFRCDTKLIYIDNLEKKDINPIKLLCCNSIMCSNCLVKHIKSKNGEPVCPYCRKNHTQYHKKYIVFDERPIHKR